MHETNLPFCTFVHLLQGWYNPPRDCVGGGDLIERGHIARQAGNRHLASHLCMFFRGGMIIHLVIVQEEATS